MLALLLQAVDSREWLDRVPWGPITTLLILLVTFLFWALLQRLGTEFVRTKAYEKDLEERKKAYEKDQAEAAEEELERKQSLENLVRGIETSICRDVASVRDEVRRFELVLEKTYATKADLNGMSQRIDTDLKLIGGQIQGLVNVFSDTKSRADDAHGRTTTLRSDFDRHVAVLEQRLRPLEELVGQMRGLHDQQSEIIRLLRSGRGSNSSSSS